MLFSALKISLHKFYWLPLLITLTQVLALLWRKGQLETMALLEIVIISASIAILAVLMIVLPIEYHRLKALAAGQHVSDR